MRPVVTDKTLAAPIDLRRVFGRFMAREALFTLLLSTSASTLIAQSNTQAVPTPDAASIPPTTLPQVEIIATQEGDDAVRRRGSVAKSVYGREELDRHGDIDITDVLKRLPGVSMDSGAPRLRGLGGGYTQVLLNGEPAPPGFSIDSLAPGDVERIEVIKGATAEFSGVAGTINVVLREPPKTLQREWRTNASYRALQPGGMTSFQWGDKIGDFSFVLPVNISRAAQGTHYDTERISRTPVADIRSQSIAGQDDGRSGNAQLSPRLQWKINDADSFNVNAFAQRNESANRSSRNITDLQGTPSFTVKDQSETLSVSEVWRLQMQWQRKSADGAKWELKASWQDTTRHGVGDYAGRQANESPSLLRHSMTDFDESRVSTGGRWTQPLGLSHTLLAGWDVDRRQRDELRRVWDNGLEQVNSSDGVLFAAGMERSVLFAQDEWSINEQWSVLPGMRLERLQTRSRNLGDTGIREIDNVVQVAAPVLHMNFRLDPKGKDQLRASVTRSFKLPDLGSLLGRYVYNTTYERDVPNTPIAADRAGNPNLQPELATGFDLAFEHYPASGGVLSIGYFHRMIDDLIRQSITLEDMGNGSVQRWVARPRNVGQAQSQGLEFEIKGSAAEWLPVWFDRDSGVQLRAAWNVYRSHVAQVDGPDNRLEAQPPWSLNLGFDARVKDSGWTFGASLLLMPGYTTQQSDRQLAQRSALRTLDAFALWRIDRKSQFRISVVNLLAPGSQTSYSVEDVDGFSASSTTRRNTLRSVNFGLVMRF